MKKLSAGKSKKGAKNAAKKTGAKQAVKNSAATQFKKGESGNPNGRPRKLVSTIISGLHAKGVEGVRPAQVVDAFEAMFNLTKEELTAHANDEKSPVFIRIVAQAMLSPKRVEMLEKMLDRAHGKSKQSVEVKAEIKNDIDLSHLSLEDLLKLKNAKATS